MKEHLKSLFNPLGLFIIPGLFAFGAGSLGLISGQASWGEGNILRETEPAFFWFTVFSQIGFGIVLMGIPIYLSFRSVRRERLQPVGGANGTR